MSERGEDHDWSELESDPKFRTYFLIALQLILCEKKFGVDFFWEHDHLSLRKALEDETGQIREPRSEEEVAEALDRADSSPLLPEVGEFVKKVESIESIEELERFAQESGLAFTPADIENAKKEAIQGMTDE